MPLKWHFRRWKAQTNSEDKAHGSEKKKQQAESFHLPGKIWQKLGLIVVFGGSLSLFTPLLTTLHLSSRFLLPLTHLDRALSLSLSLSACSNLKTGCVCCFRFDFDLFNRNVPFYWCHLCSTLRKTGVLYFIKCFLYYVLKFYFWYSFLWVLTACK